MSFNIFASGSESFNYKQPNCIDKSSFDMAKILEKLAVMEPTKMGVFSTGVDIVQPSAGLSDLVETLGTIELLHSLSNAVSFLAMCSDAANGWIFVSSTKSRIYWTDIKSNAKYNFSPGDSPGSEFIRKIGPALKETDMDNWGVLFQLVMALGKYSNHIGETGRPMINIFLDK